ncbi:hypothetical protein ACFS6H_11655 [Terrimonas rubra]|uniref:Uncharacterized protein n=1 Tax=Terrimonas rubra TaxID=1035890 RepID=A0ABW6A6V9_9BACT
MEWKYRPDFKAFPGIKLSYGKKGISTNIVLPQASPAEELKRRQEKLSHQLHKPYEAQHEIKSAAIDKLTSASLQDFKNLLLQASASHVDTGQLLNQARQLYTNKHKKLSRLQHVLLKRFFKKRIARLEAETSSLTEEMNELTEQLQLSVINLEIDSEDIYFDLYKNLREAFLLLKQSHKKWDLTSSKRTNRVAERTAADSTITRSEIELLEKSLPIIQTPTPSFCLHNINGGDMYIFPAFMIIYESKDDFALIDYTDIKISYRIQKFIEDEAVPKDSHIAGYTWYKVNKDGSRDRRFSDNYQIPIAEYGEISIRSNNGVNELFSFSNKEYAVLFYKAMHDYIDSLTTARNMLASFQQHT